MAWRQVMNRAAPWRSGGQILGRRWAALCEDHQVWRAVQGRQSPDAPWNAMQGFGAPSDDLALLIPVGLPLPWPANGPAPWSAHDEETIGLECDSEMPRDLGCRRELDDHDAQEDLSAKQQEAEKDSWISREDEDSSGETDYQA
ncbi:hypothetical protein SELMODRAFT_416794 [Selaginella moellendorffii]|uniref:Uncharacterized protein n=1 Tax=Selaginella moellendorffii TaxID=88036 RepID=D8S0F6_SELML|nr:hypothetical protein SELMODRAFT_416794 [Selaginella moellendorffii]